jgi:hypothetical protein
VLAPLVGGTLLHAVCFGYIPQPHVQLVYVELEWAAE